MAVWFAPLDFGSVSLTVSGGTVAVSAPMYEYGFLLVYIHRGSPPYIAVETEGGWVFVNGRTPEDTEAYFIELSAAIP